MFGLLGGRARKKTSKSRTGKVLSGLEAWLAQPEAAAAGKHITSHGFLVNTAESHAALAAHGGLQRGTLDLLRELGQDRINQMCVTGLLACPRRLSHPLLLQPGRAAECPPLPPAHLCCSVEDNRQKHAADKGPDDLWLQPTWQTSVQIGTKAGNKRPTYVALYTLAALSR